MGTTLTGTTPQDTYDSLIKVTDNGPISGTLKALSDGLGNDSTLSLSTTAASIAGTLAVTGNVTIDTSTLVVDAANNRVGVGVASPSYILDIQSTAPTLRIKNTTAPATGGTSSLLFEGINNFSGTSQSFINSIQAGNSGATQLAFGTGATGDATATERVRIDATGNVGIGTSAPTEKLHVSSGNIIVDSTQAIGFGDRSAQIVGNTGASGFLRFDTNNAERVRITESGVLSLTQGQIKFPATQVASADANTLDDYEEGTWTMGVSFGGASVGMTFVNNEGRYTKIGRQVTAGGYMAFSNKGSSTGDATLTGLPFTSGAFAAGITPVTLRLENITFTNAFQGFLDTNRTSIDLGEVTILGVTSNLTNADFSNSSVLMVSITYTV